MATLSVKATEEITRALLAVISIHTVGSINTPATQSYIETLPQTERCDMEAGKKEFEVLASGSEFLLARLELRSSAVIERGVSYSELSKHLALIDTWLGLAKMVMTAISMFDGDHRKGLPGEAIAAGISALVDATNVIRQRSRQ